MGGKQSNLTKYLNMKVKEDKTNAVDYLIHYIKDEKREKNLTEKFELLKDGKLNKDKIKKLKEAIDENILKEKNFYMYHREKQPEEKFPTAIELGTRIGIEVVPDIPEGGGKRRKKRKNKKKKTKKKSKRKRRKTLKKNKYQNKCVKFFKKYHKTTEKKALNMCKKMFKK
tara:strand:+ start:2195 stop:2704 length:510 start_codon:yes stop_codon:yes gene_type:complete